MRLGKEQASGYVEDTEVTLQAAVKTSDTERAPAAAEPDPAVVAG